MNTSIIGDKVVVLWQVIVLPIPVALLCFVTPWLTRRASRLCGLPPPSLSRILSVVFVYGGLLGVTGFFIFALLTAGILTIVLEWGGIRGKDVSPWLSTCMPLALGLLGGSWVALRVTWLSLGRIPKSSRPILRPLALTVTVAWVGLLFTAMATFSRINRLGERGTDRRELVCIAQALRAYHEKHDSFPQELRALVDEGLHPDLLLPLRSESRALSPSTRPYKGPCDYEYILGAGGAEERLVWVWERPTYNQGEGGYALYNDLNVDWLEADKLLAEVARTEDWLRRHPTTTAATSRNAP